MDADALVNAGSGLVGALIGAGSTLLGGRSQHKREVEAARKREVLGRAEDAAKCLGVLVADLESQTLAEHRDQEFAATAQHQSRSDLMRTLFNEADAQSQYLHEALRERLLLYIRILRIADAIGGNGYVPNHYDSVGSITLNVGRNAQRDLADFLADRPLKPLDPRIEEYEVARAVYGEEMVETHYPEDAAYESAQAAWRKRHLKE